MGIDLKKLFVSNYSITYYSNKNIKKLSMLLFTVSNFRFNWHFEIEIT